MAAGACISGAVGVTACGAIAADRGRDGSEALARELLGVDDKGEDLQLTYLRTLIDTGLGRADTPKRVIVVGAGAAGLCAAKLLVEAGHRVTVLEANASRTGGRIKTLRGVFSDPALYAEAGAMRLSSAHPMVLALADKLGLRRRPFYGSDVLPETPRSPIAAPVTYHSFTGQRWGEPSEGRYSPAPPAGRSLIRVNGRTVTRAEYAANPGAVHDGFGAGLAATSHAALDAALGRVAVPTDQPIERQIDGWAEVLHTYRDHSLRRYLEEQRWPRSYLDAVGTLENLTARLQHSVIFPFVDHNLVPHDATSWELVGGMAALTDALTRSLGSAVRLGARMTRLEQTDHGVRVWTTAETGDEHSDGRPVDPIESFDADYAIVAIPLSAARFCTFDPLLSYGKRRAIAEFHQDAATKIFVEFRSRFWEQGPGGFRGGSCLTDSPNRSVYFPSHVEGSDGGVVLASYTWSDDAMRWDSLTDGERIDFALAGMRELFGSRVDAEFTGVGISQSWLRGRYAMGEAAFPTPGQLHDHHAAVRSVEGRVHFAGDHTSLNTAWVAGAVESGVRAALEVHRR
ncbi:flavin monoamine oxidase family protein [Nocardia nepalensis]|uniref:flavin monoamine oxidase family protein n=1 Tax=Nocardia nepalensis TaxID=3375448 RepID=UPI003B6718F2